MPGKEWRNQIEMSDGVDVAHEIDRKSEPFDVYNDVGSPHPFAAKQPILAALNCGINDGSSFCGAQVPWCINTGKSLIPLTLLFFAQKRNLLIPLELSGVMHQGSCDPQKRRSAGSSRP